jgi:hypothetical protein
MKYIIRLSILLLATCLAVQMTYGSSQSSEVGDVQISSVENMELFGILDHAGVDMRKLDNLEMVESIAEDYREYWYYANGDIEWRDVESDFGGYVSHWENWDLSWDHYCRLWFPSW